MRLVEGKFYDDSGNVVPLQFGNTEQIRLIKAQERKLSALTQDGMPVEVSTEKRYAHRIMFMCVCNECHVYAECESDYDYEFDDLVGEETCFKCKRKYQISMDDNKKFIAKLIS